MIDSRIKYLTVDHNIILNDIDNCKNEIEKVNLLLDIKSYLLTVASKLESEIILPLSFYEERNKQLPYEDDPSKFLILTIGRAIKSIVDQRNEIEFEDTNYHSLKLLQEKIPEKAKEIRNVIKFIDEQIEILNQKIKNDSLVAKTDNIKVQSRLGKKVSNEIIAEEVVKCFDSGTETFEKIYIKLSKNSKKIFGFDLTPGSIKGKYQRYCEIHKEYRREKY